MRFSKQIGVFWLTASRMLRKIRIAMGHRDSLYRLHDLIEIDDAFVGSRRSGKRGRGAEGKTAVLVAVENREQRAGFIAMRQVGAVTKGSVAEFAQHHRPTRRANGYLGCILPSATSRRFCWVLITAYRPNI